MNKKKYNLWKIIVEETVYILKTALDCSMDLNEVLKRGVIVYIRKNGNRSTDVFGEELGVAGKGYNSVKTLHEVIAPSPEFNQRLLEVVQRTKRILEAEKIAPPPKQRLLSTMFQGQPIHQDDKGYFINSVVYCANCKRAIRGTQRVHPNSKGLVSSADAFVPSEPAVRYKNSTKKWMHPECECKSLLPPKQERDPNPCQEYPNLVGKGEPCDITLADVVTKCKEAGAKVSFHLGPPTDDPKEALLGILEDMRIDANFARGAAWMYLSLERDKNNG